METKKILGIIFSLLFIGAFAFVLSWGIINFNKVKDSMSGTELYNQEDLNNAYQDGYDTALKDKEEYTELINGYRDTITTLNDNISQLNSQVASLTNDNKDCQIKITNLETQKSALENEVVNLNNNKTDNEKTISNLNGQISDLNNQIDNLNNTIRTNESTINGLNDQIVSLNTQIAGLNQTITNNENTISNLRININSLNAQIEELSNDKQLNQNQITILNNEINSLNEQIVSLTNLNNDYLKSIDNLEKEVVILTKEKDNLIIENTNYYNTIYSLNNQIVNLQNVNTQLENTNNLHLNTISSLNSQIASLNQQINDITYQSQNSNSTIASLNSQIKKLEESVKYYENYIASLEDDQQVVVTFEYDGGVYNIQVVNKGSIVAVNNPANTDYVIFNGWTVDGLKIDLSTYQVYENTKIVADLTYKYAVNFEVDGAVYNSQVIEKDHYATLPENPIKDGYEFDGWSVDEVNIVEVNKNKITSNTTYTAVFTKLHTVSFVYEDITKSTQTIRNGEYATGIGVDNTPYKVFNGWKVNGSIVNVATYKITADTTFVADITYKYDVIYKVDDSTFNSQIVVKNNYPTLPSNPSKDGYEFEGWSLNGVDIVNTSITQVTSNTTYYAVFTRLYSVKFMYEDEILSTQSIKNNSYAKNIAVDNTTYKVFNGWKVNDNIVDISTYKITEDTTFVADIIYKVNVKFMIGDTVYNSQIITKNTCATLPNDPTKEGYEFDGWSLNGVDVIESIEEINVSSNTTYKAVFTKLHNVKFVYEGDVKSTQTIRSGEYATIPNIENTTYKILNGWKANESVIDVSTFKITEDTTFVADITYRYDVKFMVDNSVYDSQVVTNNDYAILPSNPTKSGYEFDGWSLNGKDVIPNINLVKVNSNTTYTAVFTQLYTITFKVDDSIISSQQIRSGEYVTLPNKPTKEGYDFKGWSKNGVDIIDNIDSMQIFGNADYVSVFEVSHALLLDAELFRAVITNLDYYTVSSYYNNQYKFNLIFDYYTDKAEKTYLVNGTNVISGVEPITVSDSTSSISIEMYGYGFDYYVLSTNPISAKSCAGMFKYLIINAITFNNFETTGITDMSSMFNNCTNLKSLDLSCFDTSSVTNMNSMFKDCSSLTTLNISSFDTKNVENMENMFENCSSLTDLDLSNFKTSKITSTVNMFYKCKALTSLNISSFDTSNVLYMTSMFYYCSSLQQLNVANFNTANVTDMRSMFQGCSSLLSLDVSNFNTGKVINMNSMFYVCEKLTSLDLGNFNTSNVQKMDYMFNQCIQLTSLNISNFNTANVTGMANLFANCQNLSSIDLRHFNTANVTTMENMFFKCYALTYLDISSFDTSNVTDMSSMFSSCSKLTSLNLSHFNTSKVKDMAGMFGGCSNLVSLNITSFDTSNNTTLVGMFSGCSSLTSLDLSSFKTSKVTQSYNTFKNCSSLSVIYVGSGWNVDNITNSYDMFYNCSKLKNYNSSKIDKSVAHTGSGGYLTAK